MLSGFFVNKDTLKESEKILVSRRGVLLIFITFYIIQASTLGICLFFFGENLARWIDPYSGSWVNILWTFLAAFVFILTALLTGVMGYLTYVFSAKQVPVKGIFHIILIYTCKGLLVLLAAASFGYFVTDLSLFVAGQFDVTSIQEVFGDVIIFIVQVLAFILFHWVDVELLRGKTVISDNYRPIQSDEKTKLVFDEVNSTSV